MRFLTGLCQDDVTTSNGNDISRKKFHSHVQGKISGGHQGNFTNLSWFRSYAAKSRPGVILTPGHRMKVNDKLNNLVPSESDKANILNFYSVFTNDTVSIQYSLNSCQLIPTHYMTNIKLKQVGQMNGPRMKRYGMNNE